MALIKPLADEDHSERCALIYRNGSYEYRATTRLIRGARRGTGYVHALERSALRYWQGDEYRSETPVRPEYAIRVTGADLQVEMTRAA